MHARFSAVATRVSEMTGSPWGFMLAVAVVLVWAITGPLFGFSETWQLVINTGTTIVTFLMVFLIQNTQNRDQRALHLKLDELLRAMHGAREARFVDIEDKDEAELKVLKAELFEECNLDETPEEHARHANRVVRARGRKRPAS